MRRIEEAVSPDATEVYSITTEKLLSSAISRGKISADYCSLVPTQARQRQVTSMTPVEPEEGKASRSLTKIADSFPRSCYPESCVGYL